ncbi:hypothetical protein HPB49_003766 [Dermacentor silvarum]|uniref:Uncharacterized protein n=1 Tax=Dermacentor silvarum TaxID=543639 RepID=A0ACB8DIB7_DERSI|nr:hypothetical protein HPB49_003766 [Dermacentor silvarum]
MNYQVVGTEIDPAEVQNGEWETILRLRNRYRPATASQSFGFLFRNSMSPTLQGCYRNPTTATAARNPDMRRNRRVCDARLSRNSRGETSRFDHAAVSTYPRKTPRRLFTAKCGATKIPLREALAQVRLHPANNTFTISTPVEARARTYAQITSITIGTNSTDATAYIAPPDDAVRGVIYRAHSGESHAEIINELVPFKPELPIIDARSFGKSGQSLSLSPLDLCRKLSAFGRVFTHVFPIDPKWRHATTAAASDTARVPHQPEDAATIALKSQPRPAHPNASSVGTGILLGTYNVSTPARYHALPSPGSRCQPLDRSNKLRLTWADCVRKSPPASPQKIPDHNDPGPAGGGMSPHSLTCLSYFLSQLHLLL